LKSLRLRFLIIASLSIALVLTAAGFVMIRLFEKSLERRVQAELDTYVNQIATELSFDSQGQVKSPKTLSDRRFTLAYSGLYWQIDDITVKRQLRSRSLWDYALPLQEDSHVTGEIHRYILPGPDSSTVIVEERQLIVATPKGSRPVRISAAMDYQTVTQARSQFAYDMLPYIIILGAFLLLASTIQLTLGLRPLKNIRDGLNAVRNRQQRRLDEDFPDEIRPLPQAINQLLDTQDETLSRARKRSADLAHGLNSPLTVLVNDAAKLKARGESEIAGELEGLAKTMRSHIDYELARSRLTPEQSHRKCDGRPYEIAHEIVKTLVRMPKGELLEWKIDIPENVKVTVDPDDLRELLGNITENALKWTQTIVNITGISKTDELLLTIEDDGKGLDPGLIESILQRGIRHDQKIPGTGIGLSLVREICDIYNIGMTIENRQTSGLRVTLVFEQA